MKGDRRCKTCRWWKWDKGMWALNGWTGMGRGDGHCHYEPKRICKHENDCCHHWEEDQ